jgi:hypothetical protein
MGDQAAQPSTLTLTLTPEERTSLLGLLKRELGDARVEVHRTHTPAFREQVLQQEALIRGLIDKLDQLRP